jgi:hypothetical protein
MKSRGSARSLVVLGVAALSSACTVTPSPVVATAPAPALASSGIVTRTPIFAGAEPAPRATVEKHARREPLGGDARVRNPPPRR